jgi:hypothetical protein
VAAASSLRDPRLGLLICAAAEARRPTDAVDFDPRLGLLICAAAEARRPTDAVDFVDCGILLGLK